MVPRILNYKFYEQVLKELGARVVNYEKRDMIPLTDDENRCYKYQKKCHIYNKRFCYDKSKKIYESYKKVRDHCHLTGKFRGPAHSRLKKGFSMVKKRYFGNESLGLFLIRSMLKVRFDEDYLRL